MELAEILQYLALIGGTVAATTGGISGVRYLSKRWAMGIDNRVAGKMDGVVKPILEVQADHTNRIDKLETRFKDFRGYFKRPSGNTEDE